MRRRPALGCKLNYAETVTLSRGSVSAGTRSSGPTNRRTFSSEHLHRDGEADRECRQIIGASCATRPARSSL
jgi:hypothetical protein